jgi:transcription antitermination factor NusG
VVIAEPIQPSASASDSVPWHAVYTRHQHEKSVAALLAAKGIDVFLPLSASERLWSDRNKTLESPLFPGYLFFRAGADVGLQIAGTPGVHMILRHGTRAARIPESEIAAIRRLADSPHPIAPHPFLNSGERVRIKRGTLQGVEGILLRLKNQSRLVLSVNMLAQSVAVEIDVADVECAGPAQCAYPFTPPAHSGRSHCRYPRAL